MQERKLRVGFCFTPYGTNGGTRSECPDIRNWLIPTIIKAKSDPRIEEVLYVDKAETPAWLNRNSAVIWARQNKIDVLCFIDSDQVPDMYLGVDPTAQPFFESSFDFIYKNYDLGPHIVASPYCGPPVHPTQGGEECCYVFLWRNRGSTMPQVDMRLDMYTREHAAIMTGIQPCAALPTGCMMIDTRIFDILTEPFFEYEYEGDGPVCPHCNVSKPGPRASKVSTEDVYFSRNASLNGHVKYGRDLVYCNWDAWAGHWKPLLVGKPQSIKADQVSAALHAAVKGNLKASDKLFHITSNNLPPATNAPPAPVYVTPDNSRNVQTLNGHVLPVGAGPIQPEAIAEHLLTTDDIEQLDKQVSTSHEELLVLQNYIGLESFEKRNRHMCVVEVGSFAGRSAVAMASGFEPSQSWEMHCVDHFCGTGTDYTRAIVWRLQQKFGKDVLFNVFWKRIADAGISERITTHRMSSLQAAKNWCGPKIDVLFLDAGHTYEELKADIEAWKVHMAPDGMMMGHDFRPEFPGVERAVKEAFGGATVLGSIWLVKCKPDPEEEPEEPETMFNIAMSRQDSVQVPQPMTLSGIVPSTNGHVH